MFSIQIKVFPQTSPIVTIWPQAPLTRKFQDLCLIGFQIERVRDHMYGNHPHKSHTLFGQNSDLLCVYETKTSLLKRCSVHSGRNVVITECFHRNWLSPVASQGGGLPRGGGPPRQ